MLCRPHGHAFILSGFQRIVGAVLQGFGSRVIAYDIYESEEVRALGVEYMSKEELLQQADVISLHCPLLPSTYHIIDKDR
jgi:D-lactate dehydrogenase